MQQSHDGPSSDSEQGTENTRILTGSSNAGQQSRVYYSHTSSGELDGGSLRLGDRKGKAAHCGKYAGEALVIGPDAASQYITEACPRSRLRRLLLL